MSFFRFMTVAVTATILAACGGGGGGHGGFAFPVVPSSEPSSASELSSASEAASAEAAPASIPAAGLTELGIQADAEVTTLAGSGTRRSVDGVGTAASFNGVEGIAADAIGNLYVTTNGPAVDMLSTQNEIRKITPDGKVSTLVDYRTGSSFRTIGGIAADISGNLYVADVEFGFIGKISPAGEFAKLAGADNEDRRPGVDGPASTATFASPDGVAVDASSNIYVADCVSNKIRKITPAGDVTTLAGSGVTKNADGTGALASFNCPTGIAIDASGNLYVTAYNTIRKVTPSGEVTTLAGSETGGSANGIGSAASFNMPWGIAVDANGNVYVADMVNHMIRKITPSGEVTTLAGSGAEGSANGVGTAASFSFPRGVAVAHGYLYVDDQGTNLIRKIKLP